MPVRLEPVSDRLVVHPQAQVGPAVHGPRSPDPRQVVSKRAQRVHHREQREDLRRVVPLRRCQLAALVRHRMLVALVIRLRQDRGNRDVACVRRQHRAAGRVKGAQRRRLRGYDEKCSARRGAGKNRSFTVIH